ncbi:dienelactone hydrolase family protein [Nocardiopsis sp. NPDC049922]|uniref:alpha/beta hydrolase family protein n=1 Tax=Nocardiopsis sp. NPDC049922 TaxID=3155157 RepID=UPI0033C500F8
MPPPEVLLVCSTAVSSLAVWSPSRVHRSSARVAVVLLLAAGAGLVVFGEPRWQWLPIIAGAVLALVAVTASRRARRRASRRAVTAAAAASLAVTAVGALAAWSFPVVDLPEPTGEYAVGTTTVQWDDRGREETWTDDPDDHRVVVAQIWYPAERPEDGRTRAPYLGWSAEEARVVADGLAGAFGVPGFLLDDAARAGTHATADADVAEGRPRYPVVVFSPGLGGVRSQNTAWAQELASHGYVVAALDHPHDSAVVVLEDGTVVRGRAAATGETDEDERRAAEWTSIRARDMRLALARLREANDSGRGPFAGRLDLDRVAAAGHSLGGAAAIAAAVRDHGFAAVIDLDGYPGRVETTAYPQPLLALVAGAGTGDAEGDRRYEESLEEVLGASAGPSYRLTVPDAAHLSFTDAPLYLPPVPSLVGTGDRTAVHRITARATLVFLDATLRGARVDLDAALAELGELTGPSA